jgi:polygalacturonase
MTHKLSTFVIGAAILGSAVWLAPLGSAPLPPAPQGKVAAQKEITAALPVIPDAKFSLADFGAVGDGKTMNTEAFKKAVAAVDKSGGGHLTVPAGTYKTLPFSLVSHMDLHLDAGAVIKAPDAFEEYGIPDPNKAPNSASTTPPAGGRGAFARIAPLISCPPGTTDFAITGSGTIDGSGAIF